MILYISFIEKILHNATHPLGDDECGTQIGAFNVNAYNFNYLDSIKQGLT